MQHRAEITRRLLLNAAAELFAERGYAGTSITDISRRSGLTSGAIYFHYTSKEHLARSIIQEQLATWPPLIARYGSAGAPALESVVALSFEVARAFRDDVIVRAGSRLWAERAAIGEPLPRPFEGWIRTLSTLLCQARTEGDLAAHVVPEQAATVIVCAFFGVHTVSDALDERRLIEDHLAQLWLMMLPGLQGRFDGACVVQRVRGQQLPAGRAAGQP
ncbi:ScbR family autoregulator-binding transcription factor [Streptomyces sp. ACA25]|uniref:ScbR family autoregulator-binding transcription factor n=1 Tax=Streptomyces sp. ACA25 TaxID=3022596 RepID=UPI0023079E9B|nr:ScbR family autoregulator-binding transcription factor [Streptomyces sp. ACA25]MDB1086389.1 ScbR family autoregulator-binding transcription factor [Streptomyces sp. ACA25]